MVDAKVLRTPDGRFADLPDFPFPASYVEDLPGYNGLRAHYLDLGPRDAEHTFLCLHGEPMWSYLYRKLIPVMLDSGARVVAPDLIGFGRSDKPEKDAAYTFHFHRSFLLRFVEHLALRNITLVVQDWGGTLGLTLPVDPRFRAKLNRLFVMNTVLPTGKPLGQHFYEWRAMVRSTPDLPVGQRMRDAGPKLTDQEMAAYDAPFPDNRYQAGLGRSRTWPWLTLAWKVSPKPRLPSGSGPRSGRASPSWLSAGRIRMWKRCRSYVGRFEAVRSRCSWQKRAISCKSGARKLRGPPSIPSEIFNLRMQAVNVDADSSSRRSAKPASGLKCRSTGQPNHGRGPLSRFCMGLVLRHRGDRVPGVNGHESL